MEITDIKNEALRKFVLAHCKRLKLPVERIGLCEYWNKEKEEDSKYLANALSLQILIFSGMKDEFAHAAIYGIAPVKCDNEFTSSRRRSWNFSSKYDLCTIHSAIKLADYYMNGGRAVEVGMKYPTFKKETLIKKYKLELTGTYVNPAFIDRVDTMDVTDEVWQNAERTISFSFKAGRMGQGGYAGATFPTMRRALAFTKWYFKHKSWYVKSWDLFENHLGGLNLREINEFNSTWKKEKEGERKAYLKEVKQYTKSPAQKATEKALKENGMASRTKITIATPVLIKHLRYSTIVETKGKNPIRVIKV